VPMGEEMVAVAVVRGAERRNFQFVEGKTSEIMHRFRTEPCIVVSESFARRHHLRSGESIELMTPNGGRRFASAGVFYDYSRDQGIIYMSQRNFTTFWHDERINSVAVYLREGNSGGAFAARFRERFSRGDQYVIYSNQSLRTRIFQIFDQTFAVTYV